MSGISAAPELALIADSVEHANARIRYFRISFGSAGFGQSVALSEVTTILSEMSRNGRIDFRWAPRGDLPRPMVKLVFLLLQCLESALPFGGQVRIEDGPGPWRIQGTAERMNIDTGLWELIENARSEVEVSPAQVHFALVDGAAKTAGRQVQVELHETEIRITL